MRGRSVCILIGALVAGPATGQAAHALFEPPRSAAVPGRVQKDGVSVDVQVMDAEATKDVFDVDLIRHGVQPLVITIHNGSQAAYRFRKTDVDAHYIPAAVAATTAYENPVVIGGEIVGQTVRSLHQFVFPPPKQMPGRPILNRNLQQSFMKEEIPDADIAPGGSLSGFLYLRAQPARAPLRVTLINLQTQQPLVFDVARGPN